MTLPHLAFKNALLKPFKEFGFLGGMSHLFPLHGPAINLPLLQTSLFPYCLALLCIRHTNLCSITNSLTNQGISRCRVGFPSLHDQPPTGQMAKTRIGVSLHQSPYSPSRCPWQLFSGRSQVYCTFTEDKYLFTV